MSADWLDDLETKAKAATPGPWEAADEHGSVPDGIPAWCVSTVDDEGRWTGDVAYIPQGIDREQGTSEFIAALNPQTALRLITELRRAKRACETLGKVVEDQCRDALDATGLHHLIDADGDGDWGLVWERLAELRAERDEARAVIARVEALATSWEARGEHDMAYSKAIPEDVGEVLYLNGAQMVENARLVRAALGGDA